MKNQNYVIFLALYLHIRPFIMDYIEFHSLPQRYKVCIVING